MLHGDLTAAPGASQSTTIARTSHCKLLTWEWFADVSPRRPSIASSRTVLRTRLCRACCSRMCASLTRDVFQLGLRKPTECSAMRQRLPRGDRSVPLAAKEARLPHVSVAGGDVLHMRDEACVVRACCDNGSLLFDRARAALRPMHATGGFCFHFFFLNHMCCCKLHACCMHACVVRCALQLARRGGGHSAPT